MKLPLWRVIAGFGVLGTLVAVLVSLAPVYIDNYRLGGYMKSVVAAQPDDAALKAGVLGRAHELNLPLQPSQVKISHEEGRRLVEANYVVEMNLALYQVDLHFHPHAQR